jgi:flagellar hook assembly protein FlgD
MCYGPVRLPKAADSPPFVNFATLAGNPVENRQATILFGLAKHDRVRVRIFDVAGRLVRTLTDRRFPSGEHRLVWDGVDDRGRSMARGVYFTRIEFVDQAFRSDKKVVILD